MLTVSILMQPNNNTLMQEEGSLSKEKKKIMLSKNKQTPSSTSVINLHMDMMMLTIVNIIKLEKFKLMKRL